MEKLDEIIEVVKDEAALFKALQEHKRVVVFVHGVSDRQQNTLRGLLREARKAVTRTTHGLQNGINIFMHAQAFEGVALVVPAHSGYVTGWRVPADAIFWFGPKHLDTTIFDQAMNRVRLGTPKYFYDPLSTNG